MDSGDLGVNNLEGSAPDPLNGIDMLLEAAELNDDAENAEKFDPWDPPQPLQALNDSAEIYWEFTDQRIYEHECPRCKGVLAGLCRLRLCKPPSKKRKRTATG